MRLLSFALAAFLAAPALAQVHTDPSVPRLDQQLLTLVRTYIFNDRGLGIVGRTCQILRVEPGEIFNLTGVVKDQQTEIELIDGGRCIFDTETDHLPRLSAKAAGVDGVVRLRVDRPGHYSVRIRAEGAPREIYAFIRTSRETQ